MKYTIKKYTLIMLSGFIPTTAYVMFAWLPFVLMGAVSFFLGGGDFQRTEELLSTFGDRVMTVIMPVIAVFLLAWLWTYIGGSLHIREIPRWAAGLAAAIPSAVLSVMYLAYPQIMESGLFSVLYGTFIVQLGAAFTPFFPTWVACIYTPFLIALFFMLGWNYCNMKRVRAAAMFMALFGGLHWLFLDLLLTNISPIALAAQLVCLALTVYFIIKDGFLPKITA